MLLTTKNIIYGQKQAVTPPVITEARLYGTMTDGSSFDDTYANETDLKAWIQTNRSIIKTLTVETPLGFMTSCLNMYYYCTNMTSLDLTEMDTSSVTTMQRMCFNCTKLVDFAPPKTDSLFVTTIYQAFMKCESIITLHAGKFTSGGITNIYQTFGNNGSMLTLDLSGVDLSSALNIAGVLRLCDELTTVYCRTQADADKLAGASETPAQIQFIVGSPT